MDFTREIDFFPSIIQKRVYCEARELTPLSTSISSVKSKELQESCKQYFAFYQSLLSDMYDNPTQYYWPVGEYEALVKESNINAMKQKEPKKALAVVSHMANSVMRYTFVLSLLGYYGSIENNTLVIPQEVWKVIEKNTTVAASNISLANRLKALERVGLIVKNNVVTSTTYPNMFDGMKALAMKTKGKSSGFPFYLFQKVDFRNIENDYKPTHIDYINPLNDSLKDMAFELSDYATKAKCKISISTFLKIDYKYKGSQVMSICTERNELRVRLVETYHYDDSSLIENRVRNESKEFEKYFMRHIWRCVACSTTHLGVIIDILGTKNRVCGGGMIGMEWINPKASDMDYIKKFIDFRCEIIDELEKA